jgi:hypothetical protein
MAWWELGGTGDEAVPVSRREQMLGVGKAHHFVLARLEQHDRAVMAVGNHDVRDVGGGEI